MDITAVHGGGHLLRTNTLLCRGMCKKLSFVLVLIWLARPKILDGPKHGFLPTDIVGAHRTTVNSLVPFRSVPQGRIELRYALRT